MASQITGLTIVYSTVYSGTDQRKHQSSASLAFVRGIHRWPVNYPQKMASNAENVFIWWRHHVTSHQPWRQRSKSIYGIPLRNGRIDIMPSNAERIICGGIMTRKIHMVGYATQISTYGSRSLNLHIIVSSESQRNLSIDNNSLDFSKHLHQHRCVSLIVWSFVFYSAKSSSESNNFSGSNQKWLESLLTKC